MAIAQDAAWHAVDHAKSIDWPVAIGTVLSTLLFAALIVLVLYDAIQGKLYRSRAVLSERDREILRKELATVEKKSFGRIVTVLADRADEHAACGGLAALTTMLVSSAFFTRQLPWDDPARLVLWQVLFGAIGFVISTVVPGFRRRFLSERRATEAAERCALEELLSLGLMRAPNDAGVLVFVTLFERRVVVLGDRGIAAVSDAEEWSRACYSVLEATRRGSLRIGVAEAVRRIGETLRREFPVPAGETVEPAARVEVRTSTGAA